MQVFASLVSGLIFGFGLIVSGMINPAKVLNFLDLAGAWDPSLAVVMAGALSVTFIGYRFLQTQEQPIHPPHFRTPTVRDVDAPLVVGATCFGVGWGLGGLCPGPAVSSVGLLADGTLAFFPAMLIGMWGARMAKGRLDRETTFPAS